MSKKEYDKKYYEQNKEKIKNRSKLWRENNKEKTKQYYEQNKEKINQWNKEYQSRPEIIEKQKINHKLWQENNKEQQKSYFKEKYKIEKEKIWENQIKKKYGVDSIWYYDKLEKQNYSCAICFSKNSGYKN